MAVSSPFVVSKSLFLIGALIVLSWLPTSGLLQFGVYLLVPVVLLLAYSFKVIALSKRIGLLIFLFLLFSLARSFFFADTGVINPLLALLTYSALWILPIRFRRLAPQDISRLIAFVALLNALEALLGLVQFALRNGGASFGALDAGDAILGTTGAAMSSLFALKIFFQSLFLLYYEYSLHGFERLTFQFRNKNILSGLIGLVAGLFSSFLLGTALIVVALLITHLYRARARASSLARNLIGFSVGAALIVSALLYTQRGNIDLIVSAVQPVFTGIVPDQARYQKFITLDKSASEILVATPSNALLGLGLGRFSSRAAMILSGGYLSSESSAVPVSRSPETESYIYDVWNRATWKRYGGSVMGLPTSSFQAVLIEQGLVGILLCLALIIQLKHLVVRRFKQATDPVLRAFINSSSYLVLPLLLLCITDVWLEYPSFTIFPFLLLALINSLPGVDQNSADQASAD